MLLTHPYRSLVALWRDADSFNRPSSIPLQDVQRNLSIILYGIVQCLAKVLC